MAKKTGGCGRGCRGRKTYRKKATAKKARRKGQSLYKVKSGWRLRRRKSSR
jgi:hypothetical protein